MPRFVGRVGEWYFAEVSRKRLQLLRAVTGGFIALYLAIRLPFFIDLASNDPALWEPVGVLGWFDAPWPDVGVYVLVFSALLLAVLFATGVGFRVVGPLLAVVLLALFTYRSSWGQLLHFENIMFVQVALVSLADAGHRRSSDRDGAADLVSGWPIRLLTIVVVVTYMLAGWAKLRFGGASWLFGDTLRNHVASANVRRELLGQASSPIGRFMVGQPWMFAPAAFATVAIELGAWVALLTRRFTVMWVIAAWLMHIGIAATMLIVFPMPVFGVAFASFFVFLQPRTRHL